MIILRSRYIVGRVVSLSLLVSFNVSEVSSRGSTALAGTRCVDSLRIVQTDICYLVVTKIGRHLKMCWCHLLIFFVCVLFCFAMLNV